MTENTETVEVEDTAPIEYEKGSWQEALQKSSNLLARSDKAKKTASNLLWKGAKEGIESWLPQSSTDVSGEGLYNDVIEALGRSRKGDASKIKTVAVAVRSHSLDLSAYTNLSKAYAAARELTVVADQHVAEDDAAEEAIGKIEAPRTTGSVDGAAALLLSKGVDGAVVAILDALGKDNEAAHRSFLRAVATEISDRAKARKPKPEAKPKATKPEGATPAKKTATKKAAPVKSAQSKAKPATKGRPKAKAEAPVQVDGDMFDEVADEVQPVATPAVSTKKRARPIRRQR